MDGNEAQRTAARVRWSARRTPSREQVLQAYADALGVHAGEQAAAPACVGRRELEGGDQMLFSTTLVEERWSIRAGAAELVVTTSPITSSQGVTGEDLYCAGAFGGKACLSVRRPGYASLENVGEGCAAAFLARFGALATPTAEEQQEVAVEGLRYFVTYGHLPGMAPEEALGLLAQLPLENPRGALAQLWLGWKALAEGDADGALRLLAPLAALGEDLEVAVPADLCVSRRAEATGLRLELHGIAQPAPAYPLLGMGLALERLGRRGEAVEALTRGLALCKEPWPGASNAAQRAREVLGPDVRAG